MKKKDLLSLLDDPDVQAKLQKILVPTADVTEQTDKSISEIEDSNASEPDKRMEPSPEQEEIKMLKEIIDKLKKRFRAEKSANDQIHQEKLGLEQAKSLLSREIRGHRQVIEQKQAELEKLQAKSSQKLEQVNHEKKTLQTEINDYKERFAGDLKIFQLYNSLSSTTRTSLKGIFKDDSLEGFIACGVQEKNITSLWDYIKGELIEDTNKDNDKLVAIFNFFFSRYVMAYPMYQKQKVTVGEEFNTELHIKDGQSLPSSIIKDVLLLGWINIKTGKIIRKTIVRC
jgi:hypothetical protein